MSESHRREMFGKTQSGFLWCLHCERAYEEGKWRDVKGMQMCPYADCNGDAVIDAWDWQKVREANPEYPQRPEAGTVYPLYPIKKA
jgi:hypothetical protein